MTTTMPSAQRITISGETVSAVRETAVPQGSSLVLRHSDGGEDALPPRVQALVVQALQAIADQGSVTIGGLPDQLTSTTAADLLGISRPTLMKWVSEGRIDASKKGTHARFKREDVLELRRRNADARRVAFEELRSFDDENEEFLAD